jgi:hypothetical protein
MFSSIRNVLVVCSVFAGTACGSASQSAETEETAPRSSRNELVAADIMATNTGSVYDAIRRLRPAWLRARTAVGGAAIPPVVYVDGVRSGDFSYLQSIGIEEVERVRFVNARDATTRWGTGHAGGAIEVMRKTGR